MLRLLLPLANLSLETLADLRHGESRVASLAANKAKTIFLLHCRIIALAYFADHVFANVMLKNFLDVSLLHKRSFQVPSKLVPVGSGPLRSAAARYRRLKRGHPARLASTTSDAQEVDAACVRLRTMTEVIVRIAQFLEVCDTGSLCANATKVRDRNLRGLSPHVSLIQQIGDAVQKLGKEPVSSSKKQ